MFIDIFQIFGFFLLSGLSLSITKNQTNADFLIAFLSQSLWVFIIIGYLRFLTGISAEIFLLFLLVIVIFRINKEPLEPVVFSSTTWVWPPIFIGLYVIFLAILYPVTAKTGLYAELLPRAAFMGWDGIVSYNRWATEFFNFEYWPYRSYYPTGFSAAWSVIYDLQDSAESWTFPTLLMFGLILFPVLAFGCFIADRYWVIAIFFGTAIAVLGLRGANRITNGYMDSPVSLLMFLGLFWILLACLKEKTVDFRRLKTAIFLLSVSAVTKQPGIVGLGFGIIFLILLLTKQTINYRTIAYLIAILITPTLFSGSIYLASSHEIWGHLHLIRLRAIEYNGSIMGSISYLVSYGGIPLFIALLFACICSFIRGGHLAAFSLCFFIIATLGFIAYHDCCSYSDRNAIWIYAFLFASAAPIAITWQNFSITKKTKTLSNRQAVNYSIGITVCISLCIIALNAIMPVRQIEAFFRDRIGGFHLHQIITRNIKGIEENGLISSYDPLSFSTLAGPYHASLHLNESEKIFLIKVGSSNSGNFCDEATSGNICPVSDALKKKPCAYFLLQKGKYKDISGKSAYRDIYQRYELVLLDRVQKSNGLVYELFISSQTCPR